MRLILPPGVMAAHKILDLVVEVRTLGGQEIYVVV